jgi:hypothetical protein
MVTSCARRPFDLGLTWHPSPSVAFGRSISSDLAPLRDAPGFRFLQVSGSARVPGQTLMTFFFRELFDAV